MNKNLLEKGRPFGEINLNLCTDMSPWHYSEDDSKGKEKSKGKGNKLLPHKVCCQFFNVTTVCNTVLNSEPWCSMIIGCN